MTRGPAERDLTGELLERVSGAPRDDLRAIVHALDLARDAAIQRLLEPQTRLLIPEEAAQLVALPERRLRSLARGKPWALRIGGSLRIDEAGLLQWARACSQDARNRTDGPPMRVADVQGVQETAVLGRAHRLHTMTR